MSLKKPINSYKFFNEIVKFIKTFWYQRQKFIFPFIQSEIRA